MDAELIQRAHVNVDGRVSFLLSKVIVGDKRGRVFTVSLPAGSIAIDLIDKLLELIQAHWLSNRSCSQVMTVLKIFGFGPMCPRGKSRIVFGLPCSSSK